MALPPEIEAFQQAQLHGQRQQLGQLQQAQGLIGILSAVQQQQQRQQALAREQAYRGALSSLPADASPEQVLGAVRPHADADTLFKAIQGSQDRRFTAEQARESRRDALEARLYDIETRAQDRAATREQQAALAAMADATRRELAQMGFDVRRDIAAASRENSFTSGLIRDPSSPTGWSWGNVRTGAITAKGAPAPKDGGGVDGGPAIPVAPVPAGPSAIKPGTNIPSATGGSGFFQGAANTVSDMFGANLPFPETERATQALKNLHVQTVTLLQDAVPGRPSNYLMKQLEQLAVKPGSLMMADQRSKERLSSTKQMLETEVARIENEVLARPQQYTAAQLGKARQNHGQLRQLLSEYGTVLNSFDSKGPATQGNLRPASGVKFLGYE